MRGFLLLLTIIIVSSFESIAQERSGMSMTLEECLQYAERNHVKVKNALLDQKSTVAKNKEVTGAVFPQLSAKGGIQYAPLIAALNVPNFIKGAIAGDSATGQPGLVSQQYLDTNVVRNTPNTLPLAFQQRWTTTATAELSQIIFNPDILIALKARKTLVELAEKSVDLTVQDVKVAVSKAYYNILIAEKQEELIVQNIERITQMQTETKEIYKAGFAEKIDVDRITVTLNNLKTQKIRITQMMDLAYLSLKFQMGMPMEEEIVLIDTLTDKSAEVDLLTKELDYNSRNEFQLLQIQSKLYNYDIKRYKYGWLPSLTMFGNYGYTLYNQKELFNKGENWQKSALVGLNLNVPIFDGFQRRNKLKQAKYTLEKNRNDITNLKMALTLEKENARITLKNNLLALNNQKENMQLADDVYRTARIKYKEGVGSSLEVMDAESALKEAQTNYFTALYDVMNARVDLQKALGLIN